MAPRWFSAVVFLSAIAPAGCDGRAAATIESGDAATVELTRDELMNPQACQSCHPMHYEQWLGSMHAYASTDPVFHAMNRKGQEETGGALGDFCVRCHAPLAVKLGLTRDGLDLGEVPSFAQGVGCYFCHTTDHVAGLDNNALVLADDDSLRGGIDDPVHTAAHRSKRSALHTSSNLDSSKLCGSCHDVKTPAGVHLERTFAEWNESIFGADSEETTGQLSCSGCHMSTHDGPAAPTAGGAAPSRTLHDHHFAAVDTALTPFPNTGNTDLDERVRATQQDLVQELLDTSIGVEICVQPLSQGRAAVFVTLENASAGHRWPSGAAQDRRAWVEVMAFDEGSEQPFFQSGVELPQQSNSDPNRWSMHDRMFDEVGNPVHMFWEARRVEKGTLPAPVTRDPSSRDFLISHVTRRYPLDPTQSLSKEPSRVSVKVRLQPIGGEIVAELVEGGYLAQSIAAAMPVIDLIPNRHLSSHPTLSRLGQTTFEWSAATRADERFAQRTLNDEAFPKQCVSLAAPRAMP